MEWNYYDTFIEVAADCPTERGKVPPDKKNGKSKPGIEYELIADHPYTYTQEEILYQTYIRQKEFSEEELSARGEEIRAAFFGKPQACMRASMLPKKYGWGLHFDSDGKVAIIPRESAEYDRLANLEDDRLKRLKAMRNSRAKT
ncbi:hypothetical protein D7Z26_22705 [Cohnella endophytica]|uniref:Uncharacterized protein n=1 Tax=Cohnella endophytica TaxID=2419778 RepID=A0A494XIV6_9BACL|nr:DUF6157 family protein [Cohnella endophytica]RKP48014.1 hypothetical protein D7Z26_22705 [Cohnella endophytica]